MSIIIHPPDLNSNLPLPNVGNQIVAGFPSPSRRLCGGDARSESIID